MWQLTLVAMAATLIIVLSVGIALLLYIRHRRMYLWRRLRFKFKGYEDDREFSYYKTLLCILSSCLCNTSYWAGIKRRIQEIEELGN